MSDSDSDVEVIVPVKPPPKRRRIIDPSSISTVPIYSNKVNRCLQLKPGASALAENNKAGDNAELNLWSPPTTKTPRFMELSESDEDPEQVEEIKEVYICSSPPPPSSESPSIKVSRRVNRKISEVNRKLDAVGSLFSPLPKSKGRRDRSAAASSAPLHEYDEDDDIIIMTTNSRPRVRPTSAREEAGPPTAREIPLKFRCRMDLHKIPVLSSAPLSKAVDELSVKLKVPPSRILLLRKDIELPTHSTVDELGLGIADIIDCVVTAADNKQTTDDSNIITVRLQGQEKGSSQEYSIHREATLGSILSQYLSSMAANVRRKVHFYYDGSKITHSQTPTQLDMEDGDVIEVWT